MSGNRFWPRKSERKRRRVNSLELRHNPTNKWKRHLARIPKALLAREYENGKSMQDIADTLGCSLHKVKYWMEKYKLPRRKYSEALYVKNNPGGDPFSFTAPRTPKEAELYGMGLGLFWGEGNKMDPRSIRLGNTDPRLIEKFVEFLVATFHVRREDFKFSLQIFSDMNPSVAMDFWVKHLRIKRDQFYKTTVTRSGSIGTYRKKSQYGVLTVYYHNKKLRDLLVGLLPG